MNVTFACTIRARLRGLLGRTSFDGVLALMPCRDIHTFGMKVPIDVAFVDLRGVVLESYRAVAPHRRLKCRGAGAVLERIAGGDAWFAKGEQVSLGISERREGAHEELPGLQRGGVR